MSIIISDYAFILDLPTYSPAEITQHCKPIMSTLTDDVDEMVVFVDETHKKESDLGEMDCEFLKPINPRPCLDVNINCESISICLCGNNIHS